MPISQPQVRQNNAKSQNPSNPINILANCDYKNKQLNVILHTQQ